MAEPSEEGIAELRKIFESCALNGDGFIDREEFHSLLQSSTAMCLAKSAYSISKWRIPRETGMPDSKSSSFGGRASDSDWLDVSATDICDITAAR
jgi:hypothetical protein